jgi:hypothetical protein
VTQFNLGAKNSTNGAVKIVSAGDPPTLIVNHNTKWSVYIGPNNTVGTGNLLDATPLDPYASVNVNGTEDVWAAAEVAADPVTIYTYQNATNWSPKAVQPNIVDPNSPYEPGVGFNSIQLSPPPGAQGIFISWPNSINVTQLLVEGVQSGVLYYNQNPSALDVNEAWIPVLSDADSTIQVQVDAPTNAPKLVMVWLMNNFVAGIVETGQIGDVNIASIGGSVATSPLPVDVSNTVSVSEVNVGLYANQTPVAFDITLAAAATSSAILVATAGVTYHIHSIRIEPADNSSALYAMVQDTTGATFANVFNQEFGAATIYGPVVGMNEFHGAPLAGGVGVQIKNNGSAAQRFVGFIVFSHL